VRRRGSCRARPAASKRPPKRCRKGMRSRSQSQSRAMVGTEKRCGLRGRTREGTRMDGRWMAVERLQRLRGGKRDRFLPRPSSLCSPWPRRSISGLVRLRRPSTLLPLTSHPPRPLGFTRQQQQRVASPCPALAQILRGMAHSAISVSVSDPAPASQPPRKLSSGLGCGQHAIQPATSLPRRHPMI